jgi:O-antigen/teichoic acid export membrane protein
VTRPPPVPTPPKVGGRALHRRKRHDFWASTLVLVSGTVVGQAIGVITLPLISRIYTPAAFGQYALLMSASMILTTIVTLGLTSAVMVPEDDEAAARVVRTALLCSLAGATAIAATLGFLAPLLPLPDVGMPPWQALLWLHLMTVVSALTGLLRVHTNRRGFNRVLATNAVLSALCTLLVAVPLGLLLPGSVGLIVSGLAAGIVSSAHMVRHANPFRGSTGWRQVTSVLRDHRRFVLYQYPANLLEATSAQLPTQVLGSLYGSARLGSYAMNERLLGVPIRLVANPLSTVYFRHSSQAVRAGEGIGGLTFSIVSRVLIASSAPMAALILWGPALFAWALGSEWRAAGALAAYLAPLYVLTLCRASVSYCRVVVGRQRLNVGLGLLRMAVAATSLFVGHALFGTLSGAVLALSVGSSIFMITDMALNFVVLRSHLGRYLFIAVTFSAAVWALWSFGGVLTSSG